MQEKNLLCQQKPPWPSNLEKLSREELSWPTSILHLSTDQYILVPRNTQRLETPLDPSATSGSFGQFHRPLFFHLAAQASLSRSLQPGVLSLCELKSILLLHQNPPLQYSTTCSCRHCKQQGNSHLLLIVWVTPIVAAESSTCNAKSCSFQAILRENPLFWANFGLRPPPWLKSWIRPCTDAQNTKVIQTNAQRFCAFFVRLCRLV